MNKKILLSMIILTILSCRLQKEEATSHILRWDDWNGWAGNPDNPERKPYDYFYMESSGKLSEKRMIKKNGEMIKSACMNFVFIHAKENLINRIIQGNFGFHQQTKINFTIRFHPFHPLNLIGITDHSYDIVAIARILKKEIKDVAVKECKPLAIPQPEIFGSEWKECACIFYSYIPGGRDAIIAKAMRIE